MSRTELGLTGSDLDRLDALAEKATPGPWWHAKSISYRTVATGYAPIALLPQEGYQGEADAAFMAACHPNMIRRLIAAARLLPSAMRSDLVPVIHADAGFVDLIAERGDAFEDPA